MLDFGIGGVGVEAGRLFAEYGADVIKIETRTYPDFIRIVHGQRDVAVLRVVVAQQAQLRREREEARKASRR